jgi:hypothetical protein
MTVASSSQAAPAAAHHKGSLGCLLFCPAIFGHDPARKTKKNTLA